MILLPTDTPLYNHPLPEIEQWLMSIGCEQDDAELHCWRIRKADWQAELCLDVEELTIQYYATDRSNLTNASTVALIGKDWDREKLPGIYRTFKYSLSRQDIENAVLAGP